MGNALGALRNSVAPKAVVGVDVRCGRLLAHCPPAPNRI
jgi:hypothetical protein